MGRQKTKRRYHDQHDMFRKQPVYFKNNKGGFGVTYTKWDMRDVTIITKEEYERLEAIALEQVFGEARAMIAGPPL